MTRDHQGHHLDDLLTNAECKLAVELGSPVMCSNSEENGTGTKGGSKVLISWKRCTKSVK